MSSTFHQNDKDSQHIMAASHIFVQPRAEPFCHTTDHAFPRTLCNVPIKESLGGQGMDSNSKPAHLITASVDP